MASADALLAAAGCPVITRSGQCGFSKRGHMLVGADDRVRTPRLETVAGQGVAGGGDDIDGVSAEYAYEGNLPVAVAGVLSGIPRGFRDCQTDCQRHAGR